MGTAQGHQFKPGHQELLIIPLFRTKRCNRDFVIPGWCVSTRPGISRFSDVQLHIGVRCFASPRNDEEEAIYSAASPAATGRKFAKSQSRPGAASSSWRV